MTIQELINETEAKITKLDSQIQEINIKKDKYFAVIEAYKNAQEIIQEGHYEQKSGRKTTST